MKSDNTSNVEVIDDLPVRHPRRWLALIVLIHVLLATGYNVVTPAFTANQHNPDENAHMLYVKDLSEGHLPVFKPGSNKYESHQPPLYYALAVPVYKLTEHSGMATATRAVRGFTTILGALLVILAYMTAMRLFPLEPRVALGTAGFIALIPMNCALSGSVTNDVLVNLLIVAGLCKLFCLCCKKEPGPDRIIRWEGAALLGGILGLSLWAKTSGLILAPVIVVAFGCLAWRKGAEPKSALRAIVVSIGVGLLIASPWLARNQVLYGDPLAQKIFMGSFNNTAKADILIAMLGGFGKYCIADAQWTFASFWGVFDSMRLFWGQPADRPQSPSDPLGTVYGVLFGLGIAGFVGFLAALRRPDTKPGVCQQAALCGLTVLVLATIYSFFLFNMTFFQAQGRYLYPALFAFAFTFAWGLRGFYPQRAWLNGAYGFLALGMLALNVFTLFSVLAPHYAGT